MKHIISIFFVVLVALLFVQMGHAEESEILPNTEAGRINQTDLAISETGEIDQTEENADSLKSVYKINIHVLSHKIGVIQVEGGPEKIFPAGTAKQKYVGKDYPYGVEFHIKSVGFNSIWYPTKNIRKEEYAKTGKWLPRSILPGKNNPLGKGKDYLGIGENKSEYGIHHTNDEKSIGENGARLSHGCTRIRYKDYKEINWIILEQDGWDAAALFELAENNPNNSFEVKIDNGPIVVHLKD